LLSAKNKTFSFPTKENLKEHKALYVVCLPSTLGFLASVLIGMESIEYLVMSTF